MAGLQALKNPPFEGRVFRESFTRIDSQVLDSHQRLSDVADNAVSYRHVISSYAGQSDNGGVWGSVYGTVSVQSSAGVAVCSVFDNDLSIVGTFNQEELQSVAFASAQSAAVEGVIIAQNDRIASAEVCSLSCATDSEVRAVQLGSEVESLFHVRISVDGSGSVSQHFQFSIGAAAVEFNNRFSCISDSFLYRIVRSNDSVNGGFISSSSFVIVHSFGSDSSIGNCINEISVSVSFGISFSFDRGVFGDICSSCRFENSELGNSTKLGINSTTLGSSSGSGSVVAVQSFDVSNSWNSSGHFIQSSGVACVFFQTSLSGGYIRFGSSFQSCVSGNSFNVGVSLSFASSVQIGTNGCLSINSVFLFCSQNIQSLATSSGSQIAVSFCRDSIQVIIEISNDGHAKLSGQGIYSSLVGCFESSFSSDSSILGVDQSQTCYLTRQSAARDCSQSSGNGSRSTIDVSDYSGSAFSGEACADRVSVSLSYESFVVDYSLVSSASEFDESSYQLISWTSVGFCPVFNFVSGRSAFEQILVDGSNQISTSGSSAVGSGVLSAGHERSADVFQSLATGGDLVSPPVQATLVSSTAQKAYIQLLNLRCSSSSHYS